MKHLRRNWPVIAVVAAGLVAGGLGWGLGGRDRASADPEPPGGYGSLTGVEHDAIVAVLDHVGLDRAAVTAVNVNAAQAETVVSTARTWWEQNAATLAARQATVDQRRAELRALRRAIRLGPAQQGQQEQLATAVANLQAARAAYDTALDPLRTAVAGELSPSQQAAWASVARGHSERLPIRLVDLDAAQRRAVGNAWRDYRLAYAASATGQERASAVSAWRTTLADVLTGEQEQVVGAYLDYWVASSQAVADALQNVLPLEQA